MRLLILNLICIHCLAAQTFISLSPNKEFSVQRDFNPSEKYSQTIKITDTKSGATLYTWKSTWRHTDFIWSKDSHFLAVNDCIANSGDALYVFSFKLYGKLFQVLRLPNSDNLGKLIQQLHQSFTSFDRASLVAIKWEGHKLWTEVYGTCFELHPRPDPVEFEFMWVYSFRTGHPEFLQEWTKTYSNEAEQGAAANP